MDSSLSSSGGQLVKITRADGSLGGDGGNMASSGVGMIRAGVSVGSAVDCSGAH